MNSLPAVVAAPASVSSGSPHGVLGTYSCHEEFEGLGLYPHVVESSPLNFGILRRGAPEFFRRICREWSRRALLVLRAFWGS